MKLLRLDIPKCGQARRQPHSGLPQMASEIAIGSAQKSGVCGEPAGDEETGDRGDPGAQPACREPRLNFAGAVEKAARILPARGQDQGRAGGRSAEAGRIVDRRPDITVEVQRVAPDKPAFVTHLPALAQKSFGEALAAGAAAKHQDVAAKKPRTRRELDRRFALKACALEQDRLRRQEFEGGTGSHRQRLTDRRRRADRSVDLFRCRRGDVRGCTRSEPNRYIEPVAGDEPARGGEDDGEHGVADSGCGKQHAQWIALIKIGQAGDPVAAGEAEFCDTLAQ